MLPADAFINRELFVICFWQRSSLFMRLREISIAFPASGGATLTLWFRFVAFYMSYPDMVRDNVLVSEQLAKVHVLASDASGPDFWFANAGPPDGRSVGGVRLGR